MSHDPLPGLLRSFNLTTMAGIYAATMKSAEADHWGYRKFLQHLCESEAEERRQRRVARLLKQSGLPDGKSLGNLDESLLPAKVRIDSGILLPSRGRCLSRMLPKTGGNEWKLSASRRGRKSWQRCACGMGKHLSWKRGRSSASSLRWLAAQVLFCKLIEHQTEGGVWFSMLR